MTDYSFGKDNRFTVTMENGTVWRTADLTPDNLQKFIESHGAKAEFVRLYEGNRVATLRQRAPLLHALYQGFLQLLNLFAFYRRDFGLSDVLLVLKPSRKLFKHPLPVGDGTTPLTA